MDSITDNHASPVVSIDISVAVDPVKVQCCYLMDVRSEAFQVY